jgi:hypothetical protein
MAGSVVTGKDVSRDDRVRHGDRRGGGTGYNLTCRSCTRPAGRKYLRSEKESSNWRRDLRPLYRKQRDNFRDLMMRLTRKEE